MAELDDREIGDLIMTKARSAAFQPKSLVLEIQGLCQLCQAGTGEAS